MNAPSVPPSGISFRAKLLGAMTLVVGGATGAALYVAQRMAESADQARLQNEFKSEMGWQVGSEEARRGAIAERCRTLARSVRILAALEEGEMEDLYRNAHVELRDIMNRPGRAEDDNLPHLLRAREFRFLDAAGQVIPDGRESPESAAVWTGQLSLHGLPATQENGYVAMRGDDGLEVINEVIVTPVVSTHTGEAAGALVLFFPPVEKRSGVRGDMQCGILLHGTVYPDAEVDDKVAAAMREAVGSESEGRMITAGGAPYMAFSTLLNHGSAFPPAHQICLYPIASSLARRNDQQWKIAGTGALVLSGGLLGSLLLSSRLSRPVERMAEDSAENIVQRRRAEAERDVTERKYQSIFENAIEGLCELSSDGRFLSLNPALARICGFASPAEMLAVVQRSAAPLYARPDEFHAFLERVRAEGTVSGVELEMIRPDGRRIIVSHNALGVPDPAGALVRFEGSMEDVTERKRAADELLKLNAGLERALHELKTTQQQVIQQERLRALGEMASGVAHDFNNALTPILGYSELLIRRGAALDPQESACYLKDIQTAATDAANVVSRLREFYRTSAEHDVFNAVDLNELARQIVTLTQPRWKDQAQSRGVTINVLTDLSAGAEIITGDASALREMLTNLVFNAVDAMPAGGTITLRTRRAGPCSLIEVTDTGTGMPEEVRRRCLEPFFSTKGERGTGLGLSMCFGIIQRHRGTLDIQSAPGAGTSFRISFPVRHDAGTAEPLRTDSTASAAPRSFNILVVDDEKPIRALLGAVLKSEGHAVTIAEEGAEALQLFSGDTFDVVITDKSMPGMNGDQLATAIKRTSPQTPVILLTGFGQFLEASEVPDVDVIASKPITIESLREAIATATSMSA